MQAEVLAGLLGASPGNVELLACLHHIVPRLLHADGEQLCLVLPLVDGLLVGYLLALDGMGAAPPVGDGHADGGEEHGEGAVAVEEVVVGVASTVGRFWPTARFFCSLFASICLSSNWYSGVKSRAC